MKKYIFILLTVSLISLSACSQNTEKEITSPEQNNTSEENTENNQEPPKAEKIKHDISDEVNTDSYNKVSEYLYDFDSDGTDDLLEFFTTADIEDGKIHKDDGQNWLLTVTTENGVYKLYDEYIQLGSAQIDVGEFYNKEPEKVIILTQTSGAGKSVTHYIFADGVFYEELAYSTDNFTEGGTNIVKTIE